MKRMGMDMGDKGYLGHFSKDEHVHRGHNFSGYGYSEEDKLGNRFPRGKYSERAENGTIILADTPDELLKKIKDKNSGDEGDLISVQNLYDSSKK